MVTYNYKTIRILEASANALLLGSTVGIFSWYYKDHNVDNSLIALTAGATSAIALLNIYIKKLTIKYVEKLWFIVNILVLLSLVTLSTPSIYIPLKIVLIGIDHVLYAHIESHYLDDMKNTVNIRDLNSDIATLAGLASIVSIPIAIGLSNYYSDLFYGLTVVAYVSLDILVVTLYRNMQ